MRLAQVALLSLELILAQQTDFDLISSRRKSDLAQTMGSSDIASIPTWLMTQSPIGIWTDVDYTSGCDARTFHMTGLT